MSDRKIRNFLPSVFKTNKIKNFMDSTSETLFSEKNSENVSYYVGRKPGGLYNPLENYYAQEYKKIRSDYQLEPSLVLRNVDSQEIYSTLFYEDLLNSLSSQGAYTEDQKRLFKSETYSYDPPIDMDMFVNYRDYYWYPEGGLAFHVDAMPQDIIGKIEYEGRVVETDSAIKLTSGYHIILNDDKEYIVEGVGRYIELVEFSLEENKPKRIDRVSNVTSDSDDLIERFPPEYITMERGAVDENPWSRNNSWYHKDVINLVIGDNRFRADRSRRAQRPIISFKKNIELYNYSQNQLAYVNLFGDNLNTTVDGVIVRVGDLIAIQGDDTIYKYDGSAFITEATAQHGDKITIMDGNEKANEVVWNSDTNTWDYVQLKLSPTQAPLFNLYDSNNDSEATLLSDTFKYPNNNFEGNKIFSYSVDEEDGIYDEILDLYIEYKAFRESSDVLYVDHLNDEYTYEVSGETKNIDNRYYKIYDYNNTSNDNILRFTINKDRHTEKNIFVNNERLPNLVLLADRQYRFDFTDTSTTARGWSGDYTPIRVLSSNNVEIIRATHADSSRNKRVISFSYDNSNINNNIYTYTDGENEGKIFIVEQIADEVQYKNAWILKGVSETRLRQDKAILNDGEYFTFEYIPINDDFIVKVNGDIWTKSDYFFENLEIKPISGEFTKGDFIEIHYYTNEIVDNPKEAVQEVYPSLSNNPFNVDLGSFAYSEIFDHFRSIIRNQIYLQGTALSNNNFRDTLKDASRGNVILKHESSMMPLMFTHSNYDLDLLDAIKHSASAYVDFKNSVVIRAEEFIKNNDITQDNVRNIFDDIVAEVNSGKNKNDEFSYSFMFATYKKYVTVNFDANGVANEYIDLSRYDNAFYLYTTDGIKIIDVDYELQNDEMTLETTLVPKTFTLGDVVEARYYEELEPSFCPPTPTKFGLNKPRKPKIELDSTYKNPTYFIVGHDGSKTPAYSSASDISNGYYDGRDLIILELEKRIYNGINPEFKKREKTIIDLTSVKEGKFRKTDYYKEETESIEFTFFHEWAYKNNVNYTKNRIYDQNDTFTYNYSSLKDVDGVKLDGHWKAIYEYYFDTYTPHLTPWEMLGFTIKPDWWDNEYTSDYSSSNVGLWNDLEEGIIRQGPRANVDFYEYKRNSNPYRREGLSNYIPVDSSGNLKDPVEAGIAPAYPEYYAAKSPWVFGDYGPVEQAWRNSSEYKFYEQVLFYLTNPLEYISKAWDTLRTYKNLDKASYDDPRTLSLHGEVVDDEVTYVAGHMQWIFDNLLAKNVSIEDILVNPFNGSDIVLSHKVGGFIDSSELRIYTESFNPRSGNVTSLIPDEDITVLLHESKNIREEVYSGVFVERIEAGKEYFNFNKGSIYDKDDVVFYPSDNNYYKSTIDMKDFPEWEAQTYYIVGRAVKYNGVLYEALTDHRAQTGQNPEVNTTDWKVREFKSSEWALLLNKPKTTKTYFKVYGYDIYNSDFKIIPSEKSGRRKQIRSFTHKSRPIRVKDWQENKKYYKGEYARLSNNDIIVSVKTHISGEQYDPENWIPVSEQPYDNVASVDVSIDGVKNDIESVPYGTIMKTEEEVAQFLIDYGRYLEARGWMFDQYDKERNSYKNWELSVEEFIQWAYENKDEGAVISLSPASMNMRYKSEHGVPSVTRDAEKNIVTLMDNRGRLITPSETEVTRLNGVYDVSVNRPIYYCRLNVREFEHSVSFNNTTIFSDVIYDPLYGIRKERLKFNAVKSKNWNGKVSAEGFIVLGNKMLPNFETSIDELRTIADLSAVSTQDILNKLKYHNVGYQRRDYLENLELDDSAQIKFYNGFIRQKGTTEAFQRLLRSDNLNADENMRINEEWAFREGNFGAIMNNQFIELFLDKTSVKSSPQIVYLEYDRTFDNKKASNIYINKNDKDRWITSPTRFTENDNLWVETKLSDVKEIPTAGYIRWSDADFRAFDLSKMNSEIIKANKDVKENQIIWIAKDTNEEYGWNAYVSQASNLDVVEIITPGKDDVSSMVLRLNNVELGEIYGFYTNSKKMTMTFKQIDPSDNVYLALPLNEEEFNIIDSNTTATDLNDNGFIVWKPIRINKYYHNIYNDVQFTIDEFILNNNINVVDGLKLYLDDSKGDTSYNETIISEGPIEYWGFNNFDGTQFSGEISSIPMSPDTGYVINSSDEGLLQTSGVSGGDEYDPSSGNWPRALWANLGTTTNIDEKTLEFWVRHDGSLSYSYDDAVSNTIAGLALADPVSGDVMVLQLMVYPPEMGDQPEYRVVYMINGNIEGQYPVVLEDGMNHFIINYDNTSSNGKVTTYINGTYYNEVTNTVLLSPSTYNLYAVCGDEAEEGSVLPIIDELSVYDSTLSTASIQNHHVVGKNGIYKENDESEWGVYQYNISTGMWNRIYSEEPVIDINKIKNVVVYEKDTNVRLGNLNLHDPVKGHFSGSYINMIDYRTEYDPANYNSNSDRYSDWQDSKVGTLWWDTSKMRYIEYENDDVEVRSNFWGTLFPGSEIVIYEWVKSNVPPENYDGSGDVKSTTDYVVGVEYDVVSASEVEYYYFWVRNSAEVPENINRNVSTINIANSIRYPENNAMGYVNILSNYAFAINDINNEVGQNDVVIQINYILGDLDINSHSQWLLLAESESESDIPEFLFEKMLDSLLGYSKTSDQHQYGLPVPDPNLSEVHKYGNEFQPRQSWFKDQKQARRIFYEVINEVLKDINIWDVEQFWEDYIDGIQRNTNTYGLVDWYKSDYDPNTIITNLVDNRNDILSIPLEDGEYIKVNESVGRMPSVYDGGWTIYRYIESENTYEKVGESKAAIQFKDVIYQRELTDVEAFETRQMIETIFELFLVGEAETTINEIFFSLVRYVFTEQPANDWVFPSTYITVNQNTNSLIKKRVYQSDKEEEISSYIREAKPFHTKLRAINKTHTRDPEEVGLYVTDFDKPPYLTQQRTTYNIQEKVIEKFNYSQETYYYNKVISLNPTEYWTFNNVSSLDEITGEIKDTVFEKKIGKSSIVNGIAFTDGVSVVSKSGSLYSSNIASISSNIMTLGFWINIPNPIDTTSGEKVLSAWSITNTSSEVGKIELVAYDVSGTTEYEIRFSTLGSATTYNVSINLSNGYNSIFITFENGSSSAQMSVYVNGSIIDTESMVETIAVDNEYQIDLEFGHEDSTLSEMVYYDEISFFSRRLSNFEIGHLHNAGTSNHNQLQYDLEKNHDYSSLRVYDEGIIINPDDYTISNGVLIINKTLTGPRNHVHNIVVESDSLADKELLDEYDQARGYRTINKNDLSVWKKTVNQKHTHVMFDRVSVLPSLELEDLVDRYEDVQNSEHPLEAFSEQSYKFKGYEGQKFTETDRIAVHYYFNELKDLVNDSYVEEVSAPYKKNFDIGTTFTKNNIRVFVNGSKIDTRFYKVQSSSGNLTVKMHIKVHRNSKFVVRPKDQYDDLMFKIMHTKGIGIPCHSIDEIQELDFHITENTSPIQVDENGELIVDTNYEDELNDAGHTVTVNTLTSDFTGSGGETKDSNGFMNSANVGVPEEHLGLDFKETTVLSFKNNLQVVPRGYETTKPLDIFDTVYHKATGSETEILFGNDRNGDPITLNVPEEQVIVIVNEDEWVLNYHYELQNDRLILLKPLKANDDVTITDRYSAFDSYRGQQLFIHKNIQDGGFDGDMVLPDFLNTSEDFREFIVYSSSGKVFVFKVEESKAINVVGDINAVSDSIELSSIAPEMNLKGNEQGKLLAIYGAEYDGSNNLISSNIEFVYYKNVEGNSLTDLTRGVFGTFNKDFDSNKYIIKAYPIDIDKELPSFTIIEPYIGIQGKDNYPKYGHIMTGSDN